MPLDLLRNLGITSDGFGIEADITSKLLACRIRRSEVPITNRARSPEGGKEITWRDGLQAMWIPDQMTGSGSDGPSDEQARVT